MQPLSIILELLPALTRKRVTLKKRDTIDSRVRLKRLPHHGEHRPGYFSELVISQVQLLQVGQALRSLRP
ncbi:hypothetical protein D3C84_1095560 [compost metagenome]